MSRDKKPFFDFCEMFVSEVVGKVNWNKMTRQCKPFSAIASLSDVACAMLLVENGLPYWDSIEDQKHLPKEERKLVPTKYTFVTGLKRENQDKERKQRLHVQGWSNEGIFRFVNLQIMIQNDSNNNGEAFDNYFMEEMNKKHGAMKNHQKRTPKHDGSPLKELNMTLPEDMVGLSWIMSQVTPGTENQI